MVYLCHVSWSNCPCRKLTTSDNGSGFFNGWRQSPHLHVICRLSELKNNACNLAQSVLAYIVTDWSQIKFLYHLFFAFVHATLGSYPQVIHIGRTDESSTGDYRVIHNLSTGYPQTYQQQKLVVPRCSTRISTTGWFCRKFSVDGKPSSPENFFRNLSSPKPIQSSRFY